MCIYIFKWYEFMVDGRFVGFDYIIVIRIFNRGVVKFGIGR